MRITDPITNWSFECLTERDDRPPVGGLVLQRVTHDGHNFAKDVRVIGLWIETELVDPPNTVVSSEKRFYVLDRDAFAVSRIVRLTPRQIVHPQITMAMPYNPSTFEYLREMRDMNAALDFTEYFREPSGNYVGYGLTAEFDAPELLTSHQNCEYSGLKVKEIFLFSRYGNAPQHEPTGELNAARFHPMVRYEFSTNESFDDSRRFTRVSSIRFDYRLHLFLDRLHDVATNENLRQFGNQAGLFADSDSAVGTFAVSVASGIRNIFEPNTRATAVSAGLFAAVEKPLVLEVTAPCLGKGFPRFTTFTSAGSPESVRCWDNVHWWGGRGPGAPLISAPGAFHCAHLHWRWGAVSAAALVGSDPRFHPDTWPAGMLVPPESSGVWGPLVDPGIWIQTLRVAVVKNDSRLDPNRGVAPSALSANDWKSLFNPRLRSTPAEISAGTDIVLWYSAEVHRAITLPSLLTVIRDSPFVTDPETYTSAASGTVFIHGFFFAHDAERTDLPTVGSTDAAYWPTSEVEIRTPPLKWFRTANL